MRDTNQTSLHGLLPEIRIKDAYLLREYASKPLHELRGKGTKLIDNEGMRRKVGEYQAAWRPYEQKVLAGMTKTLGLGFYQNTVDVYIAPWFYAFSDPLVIGVIHDPDVFVDMLTHELIHRLLTDNTTVPHQTRLASQWQELFGSDHSFRTLVHIPVHAVHKAIYLDVLNEPERLRRDIENNQKHNNIDYVAAWEYVDEHGYNEIVGMLRASYQALQTNK